MTRYNVPLAAELSVQNAPDRRSGFALPLAIVVLALLTMGLVAGFAMTSSELSTAASQRAEARAYSNAQQGLEAFLTRRKDKVGGVMFCPQCWLVNATPASGPVTASLTALPRATESVTVSFPQGSALVRATPVFVDTVTGKGKYFITSTGVDNTSLLGGGSGRTSTASRTVGVFATWNRTTVNVLSAWTSLTGIVKNGAAGAISGVDQCTSGVNVAGLTVPQGTYSGSSGFQPTGSPPFDTSRTLAQVATAVKIDWSSIISGAALPFDVSIGAGTFPSSAAFAADTNYWPIIHILNNPGGAYSLPYAGRGMLVVDGDLTISGSNQWYGVILVGGKLTSNGNNVSQGATMSGLNALLPGAPPPASYAAATANGTKSYVYDSCSVAKASSVMARYTMLPNTWMDNLPGY